MARAEKVARLPPISVAMTKMTANRLTYALDDLASHMDIDQFALASKTDGHLEGVSAFLERRKAGISRAARSYMLGGSTTMKAGGGDVRPLCLCPVCGKLGDDRTMVKVGPMGSPAHDRCAFAQLGEGILNLPKDERAKFTLAAVGPDMMRRLVEAGERP